MLASEREARTQTGEDEDAETRQGMVTIKGYMYMEHDSGYDSVEAFREEKKW